MLEKMGEFFDSRVSGYDEHMLKDIESAEEFYPFTAKCLSVRGNVNILDLGCGTGLELEYYLGLNPNAKIMGIDLAPGMLNAFKEKFMDKKLNLVIGSYFDVPFGEDLYDSAVSVESLHHFTKQEKIPLTVEHEPEALLEAGFKKAEVLNNRGATYTLKAYK